MSLFMFFMLRQLLITGPAIMGTHSDSSFETMRNENIMDVESEVCLDEIYQDNRNPLFIILEKNSRIGDMLVHRITLDTISISSSGDLTYYPLGSNLTEHGLQTKYRNLFKVEYQPIPGELDENSVKFTYKDSFIKTYYNNEMGRIDIVSGIISNGEIYMSSGIFVGMSKNVFFSKIFTDMPGCDLSEINVFRNGDYFGEITQDYIFENDHLRKVIISSSYDWIPSDLNNMESR